MAAVLPLGTNDAVAGSISSPGEVDQFQVTLSDSGRLTVGVSTRTGCSLDTRLSVLGPDKQLLIVSDGQSAVNRDDLIAQHLLPGTYYVKVQGLRDGTGDYTLTTEFLSATPPNEPLLVDFAQDYPFSTQPPYHTTGDFNGDGHLDVATANTITNDVSVLLGLGDGSFQPMRNYAAGAGPFGIVAADLNGDHIIDLATGNQFSNDVSVLLGKGDGTFAPEIRSAGGQSAWGLAMGDFNADRHIDLVISNLRGKSISVLLGRGDGTFEAEQRYSASEGVNGVTTADFNGDGHLDAAAANFNANYVSVFLGRGNGTFQDQVRIEVGALPSNAFAADFDGDGHLDLAVANDGSNDVSILWGPFDGGFASQTRHAVGTAPYAVVAADFDGDSRLDLAAVNRQSNDVSVLLSMGERQFQDQVRYRVGLQPWYLVAGDFNGDHHLDLTTANASSHDVSVLLGHGDGSFQPELTDPRQGETNPTGMVARDFNGDGHLDLATVTYAGHDLFVFLGRGDGSYQERMRYLVGSTPVDVVSEDFNHDGHADLATINCDSGDFSVLLGRGDGTFQDQVRYRSSDSGEFGETGDFNGDGNIDLIAGGQFSTGMALILGLGDGTFGNRTVFARDESPADGVAGDFNRDGRLDLATSNFFSPGHDISIHLGNGDGSFAEPQHFPVGDLPLGIGIGDFNQDGFLDLVNTNFGSQSVSLLLGRGDGTFAREVRFATGASPEFLRIRDVNDDGHLDLIVSNAGSDHLSVLLGRGDGTFADQVRYRAGDGPTPRRGLEVGDLNGHGLLDLAVPQVLSNDIAILLGRGEGHFQEPLPFAVGLGPVAFAAGDFSGDGRLDAAAVHPSTDEVTISLGVGDTTLQDPLRLSVGKSPVAILRGDFNGDGRLDLATANQGSSDVSVLLGLGDGTFRPELRFAVGSNPVGLTAGDFNGDGRLDLAAANATSNDVSVLLGRGDGTFQAQVHIAAPELPQAIAAGDFDADGILDFATANYRSQDVTVFRGNSDGTFKSPMRFALGTAPVSLVAADLNADGRLDLATANYLSHDVSVLLGGDAGTFQNPMQFDTGSNPRSITASDFDGDGRLDLATANNTSDDLAILLGRGDGTFADPIQRSVGDYPMAVAGDDFNGDGVTDLAVAQQFSPEVLLLQGLGDVTFVPGGTISNPVHATPLVADWNGDGLADMAVVSREGKILLRLARPGAPGVFEAPVIVNPNPRFAVRDLAILTTSGRLVVAALDARTASVSFYARQADGTYTRNGGPAVPGTLPVDLATGDMNGDGRMDLVVVTAGSGEVFVFLQDEAGGFGTTPDYRAGVGVSPSAIELADVDGDRRLDILATNQFSGDVSVLLNEPAAPFAYELRYRTGTGLHYLSTQSNALAVRSVEGSTALVAGDFDGDHFSDVIVINKGSNSFSVLSGSGSGFLNPTAARTFGTGLRPTTVATGYFNNDPYLDLAILNEESADLSIFLGDGQGGFTETTARDTIGQPVTLSAGNLPTGLSVYDVDGDTRLDLLVGNEFGDVLTLLGNGDGTFRPYQRVGREVALAVADVNNDGLDDFIFANEARDRVTVSYSGAGDSFSQERGDGLLAPGAVNTADLNGDGWADLIIANSGANNVLVYLGIGDGKFAPARSFFTGTNPASVLITQLNDDNDDRHINTNDFLDLVVANEGSNTITVLLGQGEAGSWTLTPGPRLKLEQDTTGDGIPDVFGIGPVSVAAQDINGDGVADQLLVANSLSDNVFVLPSVGRGFFDDRTPLVLDTGAAPRQTLVGNFDAIAGLDLVAVNFNSGLTFFSNFVAPFAFGIAIATGGLNPVAAVSGDFNADGLDDLLVAHNGDGAIALLSGRPDGPGLLSVRFLADLPNPTALAMAGAHGDGQFAVYVTGEDSEAVRRLAFQTDFGPVPLATSESLLPPGATRGQVADVLPFSDSTIAVVAALLTVRLDADLVPAALPAAPLVDEVVPGAILNMPGDEDNDAPDVPGPVPDDGDVLLDFVTGQEEALRQRPPVRREDVPDSKGEPQGALQAQPPAAAILNELWQHLSGVGIFGKTNDESRTSKTPASPPLDLSTFFRQWASDGGDSEADVDRFEPAGREGDGSVATRPDDEPGPAPEQERPDGEPALAAPLVTALFALGLLWPQPRREEEGL